jgi:hypothetical protein
MPQTLLTRSGGLTSVLSAGAMVTLAVLSPARAASLDEIRMHLYAGRTQQAVETAEAQLAEAPQDDQARFALGTAQFLQALERLGQGFHRHGLTSAGDSVVGLAGLPFVRIPVPPNPAPAPLTYEKFRIVLADFVGDLEEAEATLAAIDDTTIVLPLNIGHIRLDLNGDGSASAEEALWQVFRQVAGTEWLDAEAADQLQTDFDASDVPWLRGYCHLLMGIGEFVLAHDWRAAFDATFHTLFPAAGLPSAALNEKPAAAPPLAMMAGIADLVAFLHLNHWPVVEPARMERALGHFEAVVSLSRENWRRILAETDGGREWIPNPLQSGVLPAMQVSQERIDGWMLFLDELDALLNGKKLLPHWRFDQGINVRRMFLEPTTFDLVLLVQGSAALPYLEDGPLTGSATWRRIVTLFGGDFFRYAVWFN